MQHHHILRIVAKFNIPLIMLFGLYVQFHGDFGPGGGFQAGVIVAAAMILYTLVFGIDNATRVASRRALKFFAIAGVLLYGGTGVVNMLLGAAFLDYSSLSPAHPAHGEHYGILAIELGVGIAVASTLTLIFFALAGRRETRQLN